MKFEAFKRSLKRFLRAYVPQMVVMMPFVIGFAHEISQFMPVWVLPFLAFIGAFVTALDKFLRDIEVY